MHLPDLRDTLDMILERRWKAGKFYMDHKYRKRRKNRPWYRNPYIRFGILAALLVVVLIIGISTITGKLSKSDASTQSASSATDEALSAQDGSESGDGSFSQDAAGGDVAAQAEADAAGAAADGSTGAAVTTAGYLEDGTGSATTAEAPALLAEASVTPGWHFNDYGIWYVPTAGLVYYNGWQDIDGQTYHFNTNGYADRGWVLVGGAGCYFDDNGVYQPGADNSKLLAFTFDDGPSQGMDEILSLCDETGARVTFFMIGKQVETGGAVIPYINRYRCEVGNHSYTHSNNDGRAPEETAADFATGDEMIASYNNGIGSTVVRFPYGNYTSEQTAAVGKGNIFWNIDTLDWESLNAQSVIDIVTSNITEGDIILMHDRHESTVEACRVLFPQLIAEGYQLVTVSELAAAKGYAIEPGVTYFSFNNEEIAAGKAFSR